MIDHQRQTPVRGTAAGGPYDYDLVVVGSGGAAFAAAIRARDLGRSVLLIERSTIGGTCVNIGCIPSKALLVASERGDGRAVDLPSAVARKDLLVARFRKERYADLLDEYGIDLRSGEAELLDGHTVALDGTSVSAEAILVAAGARPAVPSIPGLEQAGYLTPRRSATRRAAARGGQAGAPPTRRSGTGRDVRLMQRAWHARRVTSSREKGCLVGTDPRILGPLHHVTPRDLTTPNRANHAPRRLRRAGSPSVGL